MLAAPIRRPSRTPLLTFVFALGLCACAYAQAGDASGREQAAARAMSEGRYGEAVTLYRALSAASPGDAQPLLGLAAAYSAERERMAAVATLRKATTLAPRLPGGWYALGQAYNDIKQDALRTFSGGPEYEPWQQLLAADALLQKAAFADALALYRIVLDRLPSMVGIHDSVAMIYTRTGHTDWAARERAAGTLPAAACARRKALCEFRAGRYASALAAALAQPDAESQYWRVRAANELAVAAFKHLDALPDSVERRSVRAAIARSQDRYVDAVQELKAALKLAPGHPVLTYELGSACFAARDYDGAIAALTPLLQKHPDDVRVLEIVGGSLLQLRRPEEALPMLRRVVDLEPEDASHRLPLGRADLLTGDFAGAIRTIEPLLDQDPDGSLHVQVSRAYTGLGQPDKAAALLARSEELQRAAQARDAAAARRTITPPPK
jgi:predicted Zn-dependent protease